MFNKFEWTVGLRYLKAKQRNGFISFISLVSIIGITLGVSALITVLSVMNGFQSEIRKKIIGITAHIQLIDPSGHLYNWKPIADKSLTNKNIVSYAPYVDGQSLISFDNNVNGVLVRGVDKNFEKNVENISDNIISGSFNSLAPNKFNIIIGQDLARILGVTLNDKILLITPNGQITPTGMVPRLKRFTITGIFNTHMYEYDSSLIFIDLEDAKVLFKMGDSVSGIRLKVKNIMETQQIKEQLGNILPDNILASDWIDQHKNYFAAVNLEKKMMFIILTLIIAVATFNLVSTLVMTVNEKKSDIAILSTMGANKKNIMNIFIIQGGISGIVGTLSGTILGLILATYIGDIVHFIEIITNSKLINADVYFIDYLPSKIFPKDVISIFVVSVLLSILSTIYPSKKAANTDPAEALRYE